MNFGRATLGKYLVFSILGVIIGGGLMLFIAFSGKGEALATPMLVISGLILLGMFAFILYILLVKNKSVRQASPQERQAALQFQPQPGKAALYIFRDQFVGFARGLETVLDGQRLSQTRGYRFMRLDLEPGRYTLSGDKSCTALSIDLGPDQVLLLEQELLMNSFSTSYAYKPHPDTPHTRARIAKLKMLA